jgi:hypothetical protein
VRPAEAARFKHFAEALFEQAGAERAIPMFTRLVTAVSINEQAGAPN